ncbi:MAG TPA: PDZ domain-containing protein [Blastocatellia bacterium]|nr:PDZ domain-containing protein [Blastocatellia bacterium]
MQLAQNKSWLARIAACLLLFAIPLVQAQGQELRRRAAFGAGFMPKDSHLVIASVSPGGAAEAAGILPGDILLRVGDTAIADAAQLSQVLRAYRAGDRATIVIERGGKVLEKAAEFKPRPLETSPDFDVLYNVVPVEGAPYRAIVTKPKGAGPFPALLLIGGLGCYSLDNLPPDSPYRRILYALTQKGFVTMRVEKSGEGDSEGPACKSPEADLQLAVKRSVAGLRALKSYGFVKPDQVFIFAHSIGPIEAALVVNQVPVSGVIAAETIGRDWFSYNLEIARAQPLLLGESYDKVEAGVRARQLCNVRFYLQKQTPEMLAREAPDCLKQLPLADISYKYMQQVADVNLAQEWKAPDIPVLVIYGTSDPTTDEEESRYLVNLINSYHPGRATFTRIDGMNHLFDREPSNKDGLLVLTHKKEPGEFEAAILTPIESWLDQMTRH